MEFICPFKWSRNRKHILPGLNPAKGRIWACLETQLNSNFCKTLGHRNTLIIESNHGPEVGLWADFCYLQPGKTEGLKRRTTRVECTPPACQPPVPSLPAVVHSRFHSFQQLWKVSHSMKLTRLALLFSPLAFILEWLVCSLSFFLLLWPCMCLRVAE